MKYFVFECLLRARDAHPDQKEFPFASAETWVISPSLDKAQCRMFDYYLESHWQVEKIERAEELAQPPWSCIGTQSEKDFPDETAETWRLLRKFGIAAGIFPFGAENKDA